MFYGNENLPKISNNKTANINENCSLY